MSDIESTFRPFGDLPQESDLTTDGKFAVLGAAAGLAALVIVDWVFLLFVMLRKSKQVKQHGKRGELILIILAQFTMLAGLVSVGSAAREYPKNQTLWGQSLGFIAVTGQAILFLTSMFWQPFYKNAGHSKTTENKKEMSRHKSILVALCVGLALVGIAFEIVVWVQGVDVMKEILYTMFAYQCFIVVAMLGIGCYGILNHYRELSVKGPQLGVLPTAIGLNMGYLIAGVIATGLYVAFNSLESPASLVMRGMELVAMFLILGIEFLFTWSIFKSINNMPDKKDEEQHLTEKEIDDKKRKNANANANTEPKINLEEH